MRYYVNTNAQPNGDHEVHKDDPHCPTPAAPSNRLYLGEHSSCQTAIQVAMQTYPSANGCRWCSLECHTT